jgi:hypothetical protein
VGKVGSFLMLEQIVLKDQSTNQFWPPALEENVLPLTQEERKVATSQHDSTHEVTLKNICTDKQRNKL